MAWTGGRRTLRQPGDALPYWTLRAPSNAPCELPHIFLTARSRSAQWTGVFARDLDALVRSGAVTVMTGMLAAMRNLAGARSSSRLLRPKCKFCITVFGPRQPAHRIARTLLHTHVCFERVTTEVENDHRTPYFGSPWDRALSGSGRLTVTCSFDAPTHTTPSTSSN